MINSINELQHIDYQKRIRRNLDIINPKNKIKILKGQKTLFDFNFDKKIYIKSIYCPYCFNTDIVIFKNNGYFCKKCMSKW